MSIFKNLNSNAEANVVLIATITLCSLSIYNLPISALFLLAPVILVCLYFLVGSSVAFASRHNRPLLDYPVKMITDRFITKKRLHCSLTDNLTIKELEVDSNTTCSAECRITNCDLVDTFAELAEGETITIETRIAPEKELEGKEVKTFLKINPKKSKEKDIHKFFNSL